MLAKLTSKNQLTLPKAVIMSVSATDYFDVAVQEGKIVLTPMGLLQDGAETVEQFEAERVALNQSLYEAEKGAVDELTPQFWQSVELAIELQEVV